MGNTLTQPPACETTNSAQTSVIKIQIPAATLNSTLDSSFDSASQETWVMSEADDGETEVKLEHKTPLKPTNLYRCRLCKQTKRGHVCTWCQKCKRPLVRPPSDISGEVLLCTCNLPQTNKVVTFSDLTPMPQIPISVPIPTSIFLLNWGGSHSVHAVPDVKITPQTRRLFEFANHFGYDEHRDILRNADNLDQYRRACMFFGDADFNCLKDSQPSGQWLLQHLNSSGISITPTHTYSFGLAGGNFPSSRGRT